MRVRVMLVIVPVVLACAALLGVAYRQRCTAYRAVWVPEKTEQHTVTVTDDRGAPMPLPITVHYPAHWERQCVAPGSARR